MRITCHKLITLLVLVFATGLAKGTAKSISEQFTLQCELKSVVDNYTGKLDVSSEA